MANYNTLKSDISDNIKQNGSNAITGLILQQALLSMINSLGAGYQFMGIAVPATDPGTPDQRVFYLATTNGTYVNFNNIQLSNGEVAILKYDSGWTKLTTGIAQTLIGYQYAGVATPTTNPGTPLQKVFYLSTLPGYYTNFNNIYVGDADVVILYYNGTTWNSSKLNITQNVALNDALFNKVNATPSRNLYNPDNAIVGIINTAGIIDSSYSDYRVSEMIPVSAEHPKIAGQFFYVGTTWPAFNVYDSNKQRLRTVFQTDVYTYQDGDAFVQFNMGGYPANRMVNYGETVLPYEPYDQLQNKISAVPSVNLVNPDRIRKKYYLSWAGVVGPASADVYSAYNDFIPVNGQNIITNGGGGVQNIIATISVYDSDKTFLRSQVDRHYTYQDGDAYIRIGFVTENAYAYYGDVDYGYVPYSVVPGFFELYQHSGEQLDISFAIGLGKIYLTYNSIDPRRNYETKLWLSHILGTAYLNKQIFFDNGQRFAPFVPASVENKSETDTNVNIVPTQGYKNVTLSTKRRLTDCAASKSEFPKIMIIGDSVTSGYGADSNKNPNWLPNQYWAYAKMLFEMDKIDGGDNAAEYNALFMGIVSNGNFTIDYKGVQRTVRARADGKGGASLEELFTATWGGSSPVPNPFYDSVNQTFSVASYLAKYRTMDDAGVRLVSQSANPAGETVTGSDGQQYTIGSLITSQDLLSSYDVCTPTHIFINLNHNTTVANFQSYIGQVISKIQSELPGVPIVIISIDETGTLFPIDYPEYNPAQITLDGLHAKNVQIYNYVKQNIEDEANGVYLLAMNLVQPEARAYPTIDYSSADSIEKTEKEIGWKTANPNVIGGNYHPNNYAHAAWGYALYSMIKWLIS